VATFTAPIGTCVQYALAPLDLGSSGAEIWDIFKSHEPIAEAIALADAIWDTAYGRALEQLSSDPRMSPESIERLHPRRDRTATREYSRAQAACRCDYSNNLWFHLITYLKGITAGTLTSASNFDIGHCEYILKEDAYTEECHVGYAAWAVTCSQWLRTRAPEKVPMARRTLAKQLPALDKCLSKSFWPMKFKELQDFDEQEEDVFRGSFLQGSINVSDFPRHLRRCVPLKEPDCWNARNHLVSEVPSDNGSDTEDVNLKYQPQLACLNCCDPNLKAEPWHAGCFDHIYTEELCCNTE